MKTAMKNTSKHLLWGFFLTCFWTLLSMPINAQSPTESPSTPTTETSNSDRQQKAEEFIQLLGSQDYAKAREILAPPLQAEWSPEKIQTLWEKDLLATTGAFQSIVKTKAIDAIDAQLIVITAKFANSEEDLIVTLNRQQQIVGLDFPETKNIEEIAKEFVNALVAEDYAQARGYLHPFLKAEAFPEKVQQKWENLLKITGPYKQQVGYKVRKGSDGDGVDVVLVTLQFEKVSEDLFLVFDDQKQIVNVDFPDASD
jgi:hypothetical protein